MPKLVIICSGGALGSAERRFLTSCVTERGRSGVPWGTLLVNATGSFLIAVLMTLALATGFISVDLRMFPTPGVTGGYTSSSFNYETLWFVERGAWPLASTYMVLAGASCIRADVLGRWVMDAAIRATAGRATA